MTGYIIRMILCSALFLLAYQVVLEKEKMHRFNRMYLLGGLVFSLFVPLIGFQYAAQVLYPLQGSLLPEPAPGKMPGGLTIVPVREGFSWSLVLLTAYLAIALFLLFRLVRNLLVINSRIKCGTVISYQGAKIVLMEGPVSPHSFLSHIFISNEDYTRGKIEGEILYHELTHVLQRHSLDILFVECLQVMMWFNPILILYKRAIKLNHEFLADDGVTGIYGDIRGYQRLIISKTITPRRSFIASRFDFLITKKRLIMMTKRTSGAKAFAKKVAMLPVVAGCLFLFSAGISAQSDTVGPQEVVRDQGVPLPSAQPKDPGALQREYDMLLNRYKTVNDKGYVAYKEFSQADKQRAEAIYRAMSKAQQKKQDVFFIPPPAPAKRREPTMEQLKRWTNAGLYGVWIDDKRITNEELNHYKPADFGTFFASALTEAAQKHDGFKVQIDLMTQPYYASYYQKAIHSKGMLMGYKRIKANATGKIR
jgi:hypothetical protein